MHILIVDDSSDERLLIHHMLKEAGYGSVETAGSADRAFEQLGLDVPTQAVCPIDLILMDARMPAIDGIEACRRIKADARYRDLPIIMVTVKDKARFLDAAFKAGAMDYITKPLDRVELLARVRSALKLKQEMDCRKSWEEELKKSIKSLREALDEVETLRGVISICSSCKKIRNNEQRWQELEEYVEAHSKATFNHDLCSDCAKTIFPGLEG